MSVEHTGGRWRLLTAGKRTRLVVAFHGKQATVLAKMIAPDARVRSGESEATARVFRAARDMLLMLERIAAGEDVPQADLLVLIADARGQACDSKSS